MPIVNLTARNVSSLRPDGDQRVDYFDKAVPGLCLRVSPTGIRTFAVWFRVNGLGRRLTLGRTDVLTLAEARDRARDVLASARRGTDAVAQRKQERAEAERRAQRGETFESLTRLFLDRHGPRLSPGTFTEYERTLRIQVAPVLGSLRPADIKRADVRGLVLMIAERTPTQANRTFAAIRRVFSWAMSEDLLEASPCVGLKAPTKEHPRDRVFTTDEIRAILQALPGTELEHLVRLLFYTGTRSKETRSARWAEIDLESRLWTIPGDKSKNREVHPVPLSSRALDVLSSLPVSNEWVFPAHRAQGGFMIHSTRAMMEIRQRSGVADFRFHDIRRTVATRLSELGTLDSVVEAVLGHTPPRLKRTYNRYQPVREMRTALEAWASTLDRIAQVKRSVVLPLTQAR